MARRFNTAGPCHPADHYMLPPERRVLKTRSLIEEKAYFVIHAPRQSGKTTSFLHLARALNREGDYAALLASCETARAAGDDIERGVGALIRTIDEEARAELDEELRPPAPERFENIAGESLLMVYLRRWCEQCPRPVVLFLDEIDSLSDGTLLSVLSQIRTGYNSRPNRFPHALALIGLRDVRDYKVGERIGSSSPFNIKVESLTLRNFTADEVEELYGQHREDTGQAFTAEAAARAFELTGGQPWLVNALARQIVSTEIQDRSASIGAEAVETAKEALILRRDTHLDSLIDRLREDRVRRIVEPVLTGGFFSLDVLDDDVQFVEDLGLVVDSPDGLAIANPIYREIIPRALTWVSERSLPISRSSFLGADGRLLFDRLLDEFVAFWRQHAEHFLGQQPYSEAAAQLIFMAFLHRIVNGRSAAGVPAIEREYAVGRGRIDLHVRWPLPDGDVELFAVELKVWRDREGDPLERGLEQLAGYLERLDLDGGTLLIFDRRSEAAPLPDRLAREQKEYAGRAITVLRL